MRLYGKNPVIERIKAAPETIKGLYLQKKTDLSDIVKEAKKAGIKFESVDRKWMTDECGDVHTQGVMAEVSEYEYFPFQKLIKECKNGETVPVLLDGVTDPQNLGAVIRNLACLGGFAIVIPEYESAEVNETVLRVANGGENYIQVSKVKKLTHAVKELKEKEIQLIGAVAEGGESLTNSKLSSPIAVLMGSEGKGIRPSLEKELDKKLTLPMEGAQLSYNVAVATVLFCYEVKRKL